MDHTAWIHALAFILLGALVSLGMLGFARLIRVRPKRPVPTTLDTYECGEEPEGVAWVRFHPRYYVIALVFVLFDVETVFILPWALNIRSLGAYAISAMVFFVGILLLGWLYAFRKGALEWQ